VVVLVCGQLCRHVPGPLTFRVNRLIYSGPSTPSIAQRDVLLKSTSLGDCHRTVSSDLSRYNPTIKHSRYAMRRSETSDVAMSDFFV